MDLTADNERNIIQQEYVNFLDDDIDAGAYHNLVKEMISKGDQRLIVNINDLRLKRPRRASRMLEDAVDESIAFQKALKQFLESVDPSYVKKHPNLFVGFRGSFGAKHVTPRTLSARFLGNMVCVEGIVTKMSLVRPKVVRSVHFCPVTNKSIERTYTDLTSLDAFPSAAVYPTRDDDNNPLETEYGLSTYKDHQTITIQEMPEKAPAGQLPRSVDIVLDDDLVDSCKPGDRVQIIGIYRCLPNKQNGYTNGTFRTIIIANNVQTLTKEVIPNLDKADFDQIRRFSKKNQKGLFNILANSVAPSIHGHDYIKKSILCMLLGGCEKLLENGTRLRGDINILLVGDPSTAKSQLLRYVLHIAPRAIPTTGRGSTGVGLTAAVTTDQETGERRLEAGAMVLADRGVVCIDEFDKMSDIDRTAIHEVMEQGRVSISKAGIHAKLNARCSVLAAANPVYGRYDEFKPPMDNIGMQDSLLTRFDLIFVVLDQADPDNDRAISEHVLRMHRYRLPGEQDGDVLSVDKSADMLATTDPDEEILSKDNSGKTVIYEKHDNLLHGSKRGAGKTKVLSKDFLIKYIHVAKKIKPALTHQATSLIAEEYSKLRNTEEYDSTKAKTQPVTARSLETMIRFATAHAKARMSPTVDKIDAEFAIDTIMYAYFKKVERKSKRKVAKGSDDEDDDDDDDNSPSQSKKKRRRRRRSDDDTDGDSDAESPDNSQRKGTYDPYSFDNEMEGFDSSRSFSGAASTKQQSVPVEKDVEIKEGSQEPISSDRLKIFETALNAVFMTGYADSLSRQEVCQRINDQQHEDEKFSNSDISQALRSMQNDNKIMIDDKDDIYLI